jgi:hypothetical protein
MDKKIKTEIAVGVVIIITILIGGLFWLGSQKNMQQNGEGASKKQEESGILSALDKQKQEAVKKANEARLKATIINIVLLLENWYEANKQSFASFIDTKSNLDQVQAIASQIKNEGRMELEYNIYSTKSDYVVKIKAKGDSNFYCTNSELLLKPAPQTFQTIDIIGDNFTSKNNCDGNPLK